MIKARNCVEGTTFKVSASGVLIFLAGTVLFCFKFMTSHECPKMHGQ